MSISEIIFEHIDDKYAYGKYGEFKIIIMKENKYINATKLCGKHKRFDNWLRNDDNKILINEVENELNISSPHLGTDEKKAMIIVTGGKNTEIRGTYVHDLLISHIIKWMNNPKYNQPEFEIQQKLNNQLNGICEVSTKLGVIDILTDDKIIEIKDIKSWKSALGQILVYSEIYPDHKKCIHLFGIKNNKNLLEEIKKMYLKYDVELTYE